MHEWNMRNVEELLSSSLYFSLYISISIYLKLSLSLRDIELTLKSLSTTPHHPPSVKVKQSVKL